MALNEDSMDVARIWGPVLFFVGLGFHWLMVPYSSVAVESFAIWAGTNGWNWLYQTVIFLFKWPTSVMSHIALFIFEVIFIVLSVKTLVGIFRFLKGPQKTKIESGKDQKLTFKARIRKYVLYFFGGLIAIAALLFTIVGVAYWVDTTLLQNAGSIEDKMREMVKNGQTGEETITFAFGDPVTITNRKVDGRSYAFTIEVTRQKTCEEVYSGFLYSFDPYDQFMYVLSLKAGGKVYPDVLGMSPGEGPNRKERKAQCNLMAGQTMYFEAVYDPYN